MLKILKNIPEGLGASYENALDHFYDKGYMDIQLDAIDTRLNATVAGMNVFNTTTDGINATADGEYFYIASIESDTVLELWKNNAGTAVDTGKRIMSDNGIEKVKKDINKVQFLLDNKIVQNANLFNKDDVDCVDDFFVNDTTGALQSNADYSTTGYIEVEGGTDYYLSEKNFIAWYDANKTFISGSPNSDTNNVQTSPTNAAYLRCSIHDNVTVLKETFMVSRGSAAPSGYVEYGKHFENITKDIPDYSLVPKQMSFFKRTKNMFNKNTILNNSFMGANGSILTSSTYAVSDFIPVVEGQTYTFQDASHMARMVTAFSKLKTVIESAGSDSDISSMTIPSGVAFLRVTVYQSDIDSFQFELGSSRTGYEPYGYKMTQDIIQNDITSNSPLVGKTWVSYGDSITAQNLWQPKVATAYSLVSIVRGVGGRKIAKVNGMWEDNQVSTIDSNADIITIMGGVNDWANDTPMGTIDSLDTETYYGAYNVMLNKIISNFIGKHIILITPTYAEFVDYASRGWSNGFQNNLGLSTRDYAIAVRELSKKWGLYLIDTNQNCGFNSITIDYYTQDDGNHIHPNSYGAERISNLIIHNFSAL